MDDRLRDETIREVIIELARLKARVAVLENRVPEPARVPPCPPNPRCPTCGGPLSRGVPAGGPSYFLCLKCGDRTLIDPNPAVPPCDAEPPC